MIPKTPCISRYNPSKFGAKSSMASIMYTGAPKDDFSDRSKPDSRGGSRMEDVNARTQKFTQVMDIVMPLLSMVDIARLSMVCKDLQLVTKSPWLWKQIMDQYFQMPEPLVWRNFSSDSNSSREAAPGIQVSLNRDIPMGTDSKFFSVHR